MAKKTGAFKALKIKQFKDLNMWGTPMGTPQDPANHPVSAHKAGTPGMDPHDMNAEGTTGNSARSKAPIGSKGPRRY